MESDEDEKQRKKGIDEIEIQIKEEHQTWKENTPLLYDFVIIHNLKCPSLTVEWLPDRDEPKPQVLYQTYSHLKTAKKQMVHACNPDLRLRGHNEEGFGLSWSKFKQGHLLSGSNDAQLCLWDINATPENKTLEAMRMFKAHERVEDVAWHLRDENSFGSVGDDQYLHIWDIRSETPDKPAQSVLAHQREVHLQHNSV